MEWASETCFAYNAMNKLMTRTDSAGRQERWEYDEEGNVSAYTDRNGITIHYSYNMYGSMTRRYEEQSGMQENWKHVTAMIAANVCKVLHSSMKTIHRV